MSLKIIFFDVSALLCNCFVLWGYYEVSTDFDLLCSQGLRTCGHFTARIVVKRLIILETILRSNLILSIAHKITTQGSWFKFWSSKSNIKFKKLLCRFFDLFLRPEELSQGLPFKCVAKSVWDYCHFWRPKTTVWWPFNIHPLAVFTNKIDNFINQTDEFFIWQLRLL